MGRGEQGRAGGMNHECRTETESVSDSDDATVTSGDAVICGGYSYAQRRQESRISSLV
jgi:hypothetical protein